MMQCPVNISTFRVLTKWDVLVHIDLPNVIMENDLMDAKQKSDHS
jgi:hypothetical protein